jgi:flagellum-specific ATP synthase
VLVEGDDPQEPIADTVRGLLDGHTWLSRKLAARGHYPAIDVLESTSRLMIDVTDEEHRRAARAVRELLAAYRECEDLIAVGAYRRGANATVDLAIDMRAEIESYLRQAIDEPSNGAEAREALVRLVQRAK